ncbi:MAG: hypothetical protein KGO52_13525 [Nitrospirota bacterium]|nr:hypothetical protein [Nitrospirota bacterium]MDE3226026.1 hypothetical protein [Nitrospirota bacterium]MDE3243733.1 hypothetical protein [Nitrospirota bacterium]
MAGALVVVCLLAVLGEGLAADRSGFKPARVPADEYPVYTHIIETKFLTSQTERVLIGRLTATRLGPGEQDIPSQAYFRDRQPFAGGLEPELVMDFILKNRKPARLEDKLTLNVPYRFVSDEGIEEPEVSLAPIPASAPALTQTVSPVVGILRLSRVGFTSRLDRALVYVEDNRPDGSGSGFLMWLRRQGTGWEFLDTEVLWVARPE